MGWRYKSGESVSCNVRMGEWPMKQESQGEPPEPRARRWETHRAPRLVTKLDEPGGIDGKP